jgi:ABC-type multidrug transport system fused ATPase/permease subunit
MKKIFEILNFNQKLRLLAMIILILATSFLEILVLLFIQPLIQIFLNINNLSYKSNFFLLNQNFSSKTLFVLFMLTFLLRNFFFGLTTIFRNFFIRDIHINLSLKIYTSYLNKSYIFFLKNNSSKLISNIITEIDSFSYRVIDYYLVFLTEGFLVIGIILFLFYKFFIFTFILLLFCFLILFTSIFIFRKKIKIIGLERVFLEQNKMNILQKSFYAIQAIKLDRIESFFIKKFAFSNKALVKISAVFNTFTDLQKTIWEVLVLVCFSFTVYVGYNFFGFFRVDLVLILGTFTIAFFRFLPSLNRIINCYNSFKFYAPVIDLVYEELKDKNNFFIDKEEKLENFKFSNEIILKDVSFSYDKNLVILDKVNLFIKHNTVTFIKGESGSGKSTLLNIICGLLLPTEGHVLIDNKNISSFLRTYQSKIGYVPQKTLLSDDSILENIVFGQHADYLDLNLVKEVIYKSKLNKLIDKLPDGINTIIGEKGSSLSGGEQQRIGIARALYKKPEILILDEATSALDEETERLLLKEIIEFQEFMTIVIVSHKKLEIEKEFKSFELVDSKIIKK